MAQKVSAEQLQINMQNTYERLEKRVTTGEITAQQSKEQLKAYANQIADSLDVERLVSDDLWRYGEIFRTAERWDLALATYELAVKQAKTEDRRVNDSLRLAQCLAIKGDVEKAIEVARGTFTAPPEEKAPILLGIYLELAPVARGKGKDKDLAQLIVDATAQHMQARVDPTTEGGKAFLEVQKSHIIRAQQLAIQLGQGVRV
jgi:tetratricopeptide (TPR) repeat protein